MFYIMILCQEVWPFFFILPLSIVNSIINTAKHSRWWFHWSLFVFFLCPFMYCICLIKWLYYHTVSFYQTWPQNFSQLKNDTHKSTYGSTDTEKTPGDGTVPKALPVFLSLTQRHTNIQTHIQKINVWITNFWHKKLVKGWDPEQKKGGETPEETQNGFTQVLNTKNKTKQKSKTAFDHILTKQIKT